MPEEDNSLEGNTSSAYSSSLETAAPQVQTVVVQRGPSLMGFNRRAFKITAGAVMAILLIAGAAFAFNSFQSKKADEQAAKKGNYTVSNLSISDVKSNDQLKVGSADSLSVNGRLQVSNTVVLTPTSAPDAPEVGQIYYDKTTNALYYYNGSAFVPVATQNAIVSSLGGLTGAVNTGAGISAVAGSLQNTGVLSVQGQTGNVTFSAGGGISISGTTVSLTALPAGELVLGTGASGFTSVAQASTPGQCLVSTAGAPVFGSCTGTTQVTSLNGLVNGLTLAAGAGIGITDNGSNTITITSSAGAAITSVNGQTGPALTVANATAASNIITINNAAADGSTKGIAAFNTTNFSAASGVINTIQGISTSASPTFANLTTTGYVKTTELRNATDVVFTLPVTGSGTTRTLCYVDDGNTSNCPTGGNISSGTSQTPGRLTKFDASTNQITDSELLVLAGGLQYAGASYLLDLVSGATSTLTVDNSGVGVANLSVSGKISAAQGILNGSDTFAIPTNGGSGGTLCYVFSGASNCPTGGNVSFGATHTSNKIAALDGSGNLVDSELSTTVGGLLYSGSAYLLDLTNGTSSTLTVDNSGAGVANLSVSGSVTASGGVVLAAGKTLQAASGGIDISAGTGGSDTLTFYTSNGLNSFILPTSGGLGQTICTTAITCASGGGQAVILEPGASPQSSAAATAAIFINKTLAGTGNLIQLQSNGTNKFVINNKGELNSLILAAGTAGTDYVTLQSATQSGVVALSVPAVAAGSYNICLDSGNCAGSGGGITGSGSANTIAMFTAGGTIGNSVLTQSTGNLIASGDLTLQGGDLTLGVAGPAGTTGALNFKHSASAFSGTIVQGALTANQTYTLPDGTGDICLSSGNCLGGSGGGASNAAAYLTVGNDATLTGERAITAGTNLSSADGGANSTFTLNVVANPTFTGLVTANGGLTVETGDTFTFNGDAFTDLTGTGLTVSLGALQTTLGTSVDLASEVTGTLAVGNGGTGAASFTSNGVLYGNGSSALGVTAAGTNGQVLLGNTAGAPAFATVSGDATITSAGSVTVSKLQNTTVTFTSLTSGDVLQYNGSAIVNGKITNTNLQAGTFANITGTGALATGSIASGFGTISTGNNITTTTTVQGGTVNATSTLQLGGVDINIAGTLSNVAYLNAASNTFTGASGMIIQGAGGLTLGTSTQIGNLVLNDGNGGQKTTLQAGNSSADLTFILPTAAGGTNQCIKQGGSPNQLVFDDCLGGAGGGPTVTLQQAYTASTGGTTPEIKLDTTRGALDIQDADTTIGANLLNVRASSGAGLGSVLLGVGNTGLVTLQPSANLASGETALTQTLTNGSSTGGTVTGFGQSITVSNSVSTSTTIGHNIAVADNGAISNTAYGLNVAMSGSSSGLRIGVNSSTNKGPAIVATSNGSSQLNYTCGDATLSYSLGLCAADMAGSTAGAGIYAQSTSRSSSSINDAAGSALYGVNSSTVAASGGYYYGGVKGLSLRTTNGQAFTTVGVYGEASGGDAATAYGGYFTLTSGTSAANGAALYASNSNTTRDILRLQDNSTTVVQVADNGASLFKNSTDSTTAFQIQNAGGSTLFNVDTQNLTVSAGNALATTLNLQTATSGTIGLGNNAVANTIQIGTTSTNTGNTQTINIGNLNAAGTTNVTIGTGASATAGTTTLQSKGTLSLGNAISPTINIQGASAGTIGIGDNAVANTIQIGNTSGAVAQTISIGNNATASSTSTVTIGSLIGTSPLTLQSGTTGILLKGGGDTTTALRVQNSAGSSVLTIDTTASNLVSNPGFEVDTSGYAAGGGASISRNTTEHYVGVGSGSFMNGFLGGPYTLTYTLGSATTSGQVYTLSFYAKVTSGSWSPSATVGGGACSALGTVSSSTWTLFTCTATSTGGSTIVLSESGTSFQQVYLDSIRLDLGTTGGSVFASTVNVKNSIFNVQDASGGTALYINSGSKQLLINEASVSNATSTIKLDVNGDVNVTSGKTYRINGNDINTSGTLTNVAYLGQGTTGSPQTFTGVNKFTGSGNGTAYGTLIQNAVDSTTAFAVKNSSAINLVSFDTIGNNLITNGSFEGGSATGWAAGGGATATANGTGYLGSTSLNYFNGFSGGPYTLTYTLGSATTSGQTYALSFYAKVPSGSYTPTVTVGGGTCSGVGTISATSFTLYTCTATATGGSTVVFSESGTSFQQVNFDAFTLATGTTAFTYPSGIATFNADAVFKNTNNTTTAFQIQNSSGTNLLTADTTNMRIRIGTRGTAIGQLYIAGNMPSSPVSTSGTGANTWGVAVQGRYAFVSTTGSTAALTVFDLANPASPSSFGANADTTNAARKRVKIQGNYAYVAGGGTLYIYDISNPKTPTLVGSGTYTSASGQPALDVEGHYVYVGDSGQATLYTFDVANPASPTLTGSLTIGSGGGPGDIVVRGRYLYLTNYNAGAVPFYVMDLVNPAVPSVAGSIIASMGTLTSLTVQGRYAYAGNSTGSIYPIDVSNPASPSAGSAVSMGASANAQGLYAQGRTLYIADSSTPAIRSMDISTPGTPVAISGTASLTSSSPAQALVVSGRYLYAVTSTAAYGLQTFDMGGTYAQQLEVGGIEADALSVRSAASFAGDATIQGALGVGSGLQVSGNSAFYGGNAVTDGLVVGGAQTTAKVMSVLATAITTGAGFSVNSSSTAQTSGNVASLIQSSAYSTTGLTLSGSVLNVSRALTPNIPAASPPALDTSTSLASQASSTQWSPTITVASNSNRVLIVWVISQCFSSGCTPATPSSVTYDSDAQTMTEVAANGSNGSITAVDPSTNYGTRMKPYYLASPNAGSGKIVHVNWGSSTSGYVTMQSWYNANTTTPVGAPSAVNNAGGSPTVNVASMSGDMVLDGTYGTSFFFPSPTITVLSGNGQTAVQTSVLSYANEGTSYKTATSTSTTMAWTSQASNSQIGFALKQANTGIVNVTGAVAQLSNSCTATLGSCTDTSNVLNLNQQYASATGAVLKIQNSGTGKGIEVFSGASSVFSIGNSASAEGATLFQNKTNNTTAFQVQNSAGGSLLNIDTTNSNISLNSNNTGNTQAWTSGTALTGAAAERWKFDAVSANGFLYVVGGNGNGAGTENNTVYYSKIKSDGSNGAWATTNTIPQARGENATVVGNGYIYSVGGHNASDATMSTVFYAKLNTDGTTGTWKCQGTSSTPCGGATPVNSNYISSDGGTTEKKMEGGRAIIYNGYIYAIGGSTDGTNSTTGIYYARLNADGSTGSWTSTTALPAARMYHTASVSNGYLYVTGGATGANMYDTVMFAPINASGTIGTWSCNGADSTACGMTPTSTSSSLRLPDSTGMRGATSVMLNGYLYVLGGRNSGGTIKNTIYFTALSSTGQVSGWSTSTNAITTNGSTAAPRWLAGATVANGYIYFIGGDPDNSGTLATTVLYVSTSRLRVGGSIDLVGLNTQNIAEFGGGGELTAGNTNIVGTLQVQGAANFTQGVSVSGVLNVSGTAYLDSTLTVAGAVSFSSTLSVTGATTFSGGITLTGHLKSTQTTAPTIGTPSSCGTSPSASVTTASTDTAGSFTITAGTGGGYTTCDTIITFNAAYGAAPKSIIVVPKDSAAASAVRIYVSASSTTTFTVKYGTAPVSDGEADAFYYWVVE